MAGGQQKPFIKKPTCYMCEIRPAKPLTAKRDGSFYTNAQDVVTFCSYRCAANYALLWGVHAIEDHAHFCPSQEKWIQCAREFECPHCNESE